MRKIGRVRERITQVLRDAGFELDASQIWLQHPHYIHYYGCCRWGAQANFEGRQVSISSWDTMNDILKSGGIDISRDGLNYEVHRKN